MARLVLFACLMLCAAYVSAENHRLDLEQCSEDCTQHCGKKKSYITGMCVANEGDAPSSYMASCTPGGEWNVKQYLTPDCTGAMEPELGSSTACHPFPNKLPVKFVSKTDSEVVVKICGQTPTSEATDCDVELCKKKTLMTTTPCGKVDGMNYYYTAKATGEDASATLTLGLYDDVESCEAAVAPIFYKENMAKDACIAYTQAFKGTCTVVPPDTTSTDAADPTTHGSSSETTSDDKQDNSDGKPGSDNDTTSYVVSDSFIAALLALMAILVVIY